MNKGILAVIGVIAMALTVIFLIFYIWSDWDQFYLKSLLTSFIVFAVVYFITILKEK